MIHFFSHLAPLAPGIVPHPQQHGPSWTCCHSHPHGAPGLCPHPGASQATGLAACRDPLGPSCSCPHHTSTCSELGQVSVVEGSGPLHTILNLTLPHWLPWGGPFCLWENPNGPKEGAALVHQQRRV